MNDNKIVCFARNKWILLVLSCYYCFIGRFAAAEITNTKVPSSPSLLVISFDAFRPEYFHRNVTPFMDRIRKEGVQLNYLKNVFPTKTFVNHHSIATGLYPDVHGVVSNSLFDLKTKTKLDYGYELFHYNEDILPIWILNQKFGKYSGCMMWPGSNFVYSGTECTFIEKFNETVPWDQRVNTVFSWLQDKKTPASLVMMYFEEPDYLGHAFSPDSETITNMVSRADNITKYIFDKLQADKLDQRVNVIVLSDHGMDSVSSPNFINLELSLQNDTYDMYGSSPVLQIVPKEGRLDEVFRNLSIASKENGNFKIYQNKDLPKKWHSANAQRMGPITAVANIGYAFQDMFASQIFYNKTFGVPISPTQKYGVHGYDNDIETMHAIFFAKGPQFKTNHTIDKLNNVDLYNLFSLILNLTPTQNNGTLEDVLDFLLNINDPKSFWSQKSVQYAALISLPVLIIILLAGILIIIKCKKPTETKTFTLDSDESIAALEEDKLLQHSTV